jgi:hypothetical protein
MFQQLTFLWHLHACGFYSGRVEPASAAESEVLRIRLLTPPCPVAFQIAGESWLCRHTDSFYQDASSGDCGNKGKAAPLKAFTRAAGHRPLK